MKGKGSGRLLLSNGFGDVNKIAMEKEKERGIMSRQSRLFPRPLFAVMFLGFVLGVLLTVGKRSSKEEPAGRTARHKVDSSPDEVLKYWTRDRMQNAKPAEMPEIKKSEPEKKSQEPPTSTDQ